MDGKKKAHSARRQLVDKLLNDLIDIRTGGYNQSGSCEIVLALAKSNPLVILNALEIAHANGRVEALNEMTNRVEGFYSASLRVRHAVLRMATNRQEPTNE